MIPEREKVLYLTFDDGPTQEITEWVLDQLSQYNAYATFFMVGNNVRRNPEIAHKVIDAGHTVGNHTQNHVNGWKTETRAYLREVLEAQNTISEYTGYKTHLFRPPHGRITYTQAQYIRKHLEIVMMDTISGDFDNKIDAGVCIKNVVESAKPGSIIVFHDSLKAWDRLRLALPETLRHFSEAGYKFASLQPFRPKETGLPKIFA
ncbi:MAG: polysaccharide deacetylase family protein [Bacteroidota bacterium]